MSKRVLTIHLLEGTTTGLQVAGLDSWIGRVFVAPKSDLPSLLKHEEIKNALGGVYVLVGDDPNQIEKNIIYVGQGNVANRLVLHNQDSTKDYWDNKTLAFVAKDETLNTAVCLYLESRLIDLAKKSSSTPTVKNATSPAPPSLSATDRTMAENFLTQALILLPALGIDCFVQPPPTVVPTLGLSPQFTFSRQDCAAEAEFINNQFVVLKGSFADTSETPSIGASNRSLRSQLRSNKSLVDDPASGKWIFTKNVAFNSPSAAAGVVGGAMMAGTTAWKLKGTQQTYGDWDKNRVNAASPPVTGPSPTAGATP